MDGGDGEPIGDGLGKFSMKRDNLRMGVAPVSS